jgi:hypothetical protein
MRCNCILDQDRPRHSKQCSWCNELDFLMKDVARLVKWASQLCTMEHISHITAPLKQKATSLHAYRSRLIRHFTQTHGKIKVSLNLKQGLASCWQTGRC